MSQGLSVIIPNYNHAHYLDEAINSVLTQSRRPNEVLICDDCSTDNSLEVIQKYLSDPIVKLIKNNVNRGVAATCNDALAHAQFNSVFFLAADDKALPGLFESSMEILETYPQAAFCCSHPAFMDKDGTVDLHENWYKLSLEPKYVSSIEAKDVVGPDKLWIAGHTCIFRKARLQECGGLRENLRWHCDWFAFHVMAFRFGFCYVPEPLSALRILKDSYSANSSIDIDGSAKVFWEIAQILKTPEFQDVKSAFCESQVLASHPEYRNAIIAEAEPWRTMLVSRATYLDKVDSTNFGKELKKELITETHERRAIDEAIDEAIKDNAISFNKEITTQVSALEITLTDLNQSTTIEMRTQIIKLWAELVTIRSEINVVHEELLTLKRQTQFWINLKGKLQKLRHLPRMLKRPFTNTKSLPS